MEERKDQLYVAFVPRKGGEFQILSLKNKEEMEEAVKFWVVDKDISTGRIEDTQIIPLYMPAEEYEKNWRGDTSWDEEKVNSFLKENETYKPKVSSLKEIAATALKASKDYPEYKKQIKENQPMEIRALFFEKGRSLEKKPKEITSPGPLLDDSSDVTNKKNK